VILQQLDFLLKLTEFV